MSTDQRRLDLLSADPPGPAVPLLVAGVFWVWYAANILVHLDITGDRFAGYVDRGWFGVLVLCAVGAGYVLTRSPVWVPRRALWSALAGVAGLVGVLAAGDTVWRGVVVALTAPLVVYTAWRLLDLPDRPDGSEPPPLPRGPGKPRVRSTTWDRHTLGTTFQVSAPKGLMWMVIGVVVGIPFGVANLVFRLSSAELDPQPAGPALLEALEPAIVGELVLRLLLGALWFAAMRGRRRTGRSVLGLYALLTIPFAMLMMTDVLVSTPVIGILGIIAHALFTGVPLTFLATQVNVQSAVGFHWALQVPLALAI